MFPHAFPFRSANHPLEAEEGHLSENWDPVEITRLAKQLRTQNQECFKRVFQLDFVVMTVDDCLFWVLLLFVIVVVLLLTLQAEKVDRPFQKGLLNLQIQLLSLGFWCHGHGVFFNRLSTFTLLTKVSGIPEFHNFITAENSFDPAAILAYSFWTPVA